MFLLTPHAPLSDVRKIGVLRANGIGDLLFAVPALKAIRAAYPAAELTLLAAGWHAPFLSGRGIVDRVIEVPPCEGVRAGLEDQAELDSFFDLMQRERFDVALQMHGGGRYSNPFIKRLGAGLTAGLQTPDAEPLDLVVPYVYVQHEVMRYLEVVALIGARPLELEPSIPVLPEELLEADAALAGMPGPIVALNGGATDARRRWPPEYFALAGDALAEAGARVIVLGDTRDRPIADAIVERMRHPACNLAGTLTLNGLVGVLSSCDLLISNDSGPLHLAEAVGTPTVGIYWCGNLVTAAPFFRTQHRLSVSWRLQCPVCGEANVLDSRCEHDVSFVSDIPVDEIVSQSLELLASGGGAAGTPATTGQIRRASR